MKIDNRMSWISFVFSVSLALLPVVALPVLGASPEAQDKAAGREKAPTKGGSVKAKAKSTAKKSKAVKKTNEDLAIDFVWRRPEVKAWLKLFPHGTSKLGGHAAATADLDHGEIYSVHVYEDLPDHTATFGWYDVNVKSGKVTKKEL
jgi:hypothetical protein